MTLLILKINSLFHGIPLCSSYKKRIEANTLRNPSNFIFPLNPLQMK